MDPDKDLQDMRYAIERLLVLEWIPDSEDEQAELNSILLDSAEALDHWLSSGGFLPEKWEKAQKYNREEVYHYQSRRR